MIRAMSAYENVVGGKLKLKGKPLNVKAGGMKKKKKKHKEHQDQVSQLVDDNELISSYLPYELILSTREKNEVT